ncbi:MAG: outer membrane beta-barrel protein [Sphingobacteriaceae bacterium]|nr:outer membrane beta-barrel protein [Sphingobacteriaceae bacterium]
MKKMLLLLLLAAATVPAQAQFFQLGIRGGVSSYNVRYQDFTNINNVSIESSSDLGMHLGFYSRIQVLGFYVQPELLYTRTGSQITTTTGNNTNTADLRFQRIDIPVLVGKKFFGVFRANTGPVFSSLIRADLTESNIKANITDAYRNNTVGFQVGVGLDIWKLVLDLKYEGSLGKFGESITTGGQSFTTDARPSQWLISVGYRVF